MSELVKGVPRAQYERERADAKRRNRERVRRPGKLAEVASPVRWLPEPVMAGGLRIVGVCRDASPETKALYL
jgi:hypothetical protein